MKNAKDSIVANTKSPNEAIQYLRNISKTYVAIIPGAGKYVDKTFDELDELSQSHGQEVQEIVSKAASEVQETIEVRSGFSLEGFLIPLETRVIA